MTTIDKLRDKYRRQILEEESGPSQTGIHHCSLWTWDFIFGFVKTALTQDKNCRKGLLITKWTFQWLFVCLHYEAELLTFVFALQLYYYAIMVCGSSIRVDVKPPISLYEIKSGLSYFCFIFHYYLPELEVINHVCPLSEFKTKTLCRSGFWVKNNLMLRWSHIKLWDLKHYRNMHR